MTRIRYVKHPDQSECFISVRSYPTNSGNLRVHLNPADGVYALLMDSGQPLVTGKASSLAQLKAKAKSALELQGVNFDDEGRNRK